MKNNLLVLLFAIGIHANAQLTVTATNDNICLGNCATLTASASGGIPPYSYSWSSGETTTAIVICPTASTTYTVVATDASPTTASAISTISVSSPPAVVIVGNTTIMSGDVATLSASGGGNYSWFPSTGLNTTSGAVVMASPTSTTVYCVVGTFGSCSDTACATVTVNPSGIKDFYDDKSISIYPNPSNGVFSIIPAIAGVRIQIKSIEIENMLGEKIYSISQPLTNTTIDLSAKPGGNYLLHLITDKGIINKKIVIQK